MSSKPSQSKNVFSVPTQQDLTNVLSFEDCSQILEELGCDLYTVEHTPKRTIFKVKTANDREALLQSIFDAIANFGFEPVRVGTSQFSKSKGHVVSNGFYFVAKPINGATENLQIRSSSLCELGVRETVELNGSKVECFVFKSQKELQQSILTGLQDNDKVSDGIYQTIYRYFSTFGNVFGWDPSVLPSEKNELGKYLGELLIGMFAFNKKWYGFNGSKFIVPVSSSYSGIDSAIMSKDGELIQISNKFGVGAKASFFANILPKLAGFSDKKLEKAPVIKKILDIMQHTDKQKEVVYEYGVRHILRLSKKLVPEPISLYRELNSDKKKLSESSLAIIEAIKKTCGPQVLGFLTPKYRYSSVTGFFTRRMANDINLDPGSMKLIKLALADKNFVQANLNISKWIKGVVDYTFTNSGDVDVTIYGDKSAPGDIHARQGLLNYTIKQFDNQ